MKKTVIVHVSKPLTKKERRMFSKEHPGMRLCFRLRFPNAPKLLWALNGVLWFLVIVKRVLLR